MSYRNKGLRAFDMGEVREIRARYAQGESQGRLAREYRVNVTTIARMVRGETYQEDSRTGIEQPCGDVDYETGGTGGYIARARAGEWPPIPITGKDGRVIGVVNPKTTDEELAEWQQIAREETPVPVAAMPDSRLMRATLEFVEKHRNAQSAAKDHSDNQLGYSGEID